MTAHSGLRMASGVCVPRSRLDLAPGTAWPPYDDTAIERQFGRDADHRRGPIEERASFECPARKGSERPGQRQVHRTPRPRKTGACSSSRLWSVRARHRRGCVLHLGPRARDAPAETSRAAARSMEGASSRRANRRGDEETRWRRRTTPNSYQKSPRRQPHR